MKAFRIWPAVMLALALLAGCMHDLHAASSYEKTRTFTTGEAIASQGLLLKLSGATVIKCGSGGDFIGVSMGAAANGAQVGVVLLKPVVLMQADGVVSVGNDVYAGASGQVGTTVAGRRIGIALSAGATGGDMIEVALDGGSLKANLSADTISEITSTAGVTIDGVKLKDSQPYCDVINEKTAATGVTVDGVLLKDFNVAAGASGSAGYVSSYPSTASKGSLKLAAADSAGDTVTTITNASQAAARTYTIPDAGAAASFTMTEGAQTINGVKTFGSTVLTSAVFLSGELTGNGSAQNTAHGLAAVPKVVIAIPSDLSGGVFTVVAGSHDSTNAIFTVTNGEKYKVLCIR